MTARAIVRRFALTLGALAVAAGAFARSGEGAGADRAGAAAVTPPAVAHPAPLAGAARERPHGAHAPDDPRARGGCDLLAEYLAEERPAPGTCPRRAAGAEPLVDPPVVVSLPDLRDSRLDWAFDGGVEAVRRAYERTGYVLDRFWLPWAVDADTLHGPRGHEADSAALRFTYPGVLLFRRLATPDAAARVHRREVRLVYVVGEVATGGVNPRVVARVLAERDRVLAALGDPARRRADTLRVVGPVFSGSVRSMVAALDRWTRADATRHAVMVSGGATAAANKAAVDATAAGRRVAPGALPGTLAWTPTPCVAPDPQPHVDFWATANPVDSVLAVTRRLLQRELGIGERAVAVLRESSTAFGAAAGGPGSAGQPPGRRTARPGDCVPFAAAPGAAGWLEIPVPMNIARLRDGLLRAAAAGAAGQPALPGAPRARLTALDLQDPATARENLPALSPLSAPAAERTLEDIAQTLIAHRVRAVVVVASDVRDRVFLATEVRTRLRDVKVVVVGAHSLYLRPEVNQALRGTLVVSTYPVFMESQYWDAAPGADRQRLAFTSDVSAGTYNAALVQLGEGARVVDYTAPLAGLGARDSTRVPVAARTPPVWVTVVGRGALLPVRAVALGWTPAGGTTAGGTTAGGTTAGGTTADARRAESHWYVVPRPRAVVTGGGASPAGVAAAAAAGGSAVAGAQPAAGVAGAEGAAEPPAEVLKADVATLDDYLLAALVASAALSAFAGFRLTDGAAPLGFGGRARAVPLPTRWAGAPVRVGGARPAAAVAPAADALRRDRAWGPPLLELELHNIAWTLLRHAALLGTVAPVVLVLCRGRIHGAAAEVLPAWAFGVTAALLGAALVGEDAGRVRALARGFGRGVVARLALRPVLVAGLALAYAGASTWLTVQVLAGTDGAAAPARAGGAVFAARALQLGSGVSPLAPLFVGGLLLLASSAWHLARVRQLREVPTFEAACALGAVAAPGCPGRPAAGRSRVTSWRRAAARARRHLARRPSARPVVVGSARAFAAAVGGLRAQLIHVVPTVAGGLLVLLLLALVGWMGLHIERTPETLALGPVVAGHALPSTFDLLFRGVQAAALTLGAWTLFRFVGTWAALRRCLYGVATTGLVPAFARLPRLMAELSRLTPFSMPPKPVTDAAFQTVGREGWAALARDHAAEAAELRAAMRAAAHQAAPDAVAADGAGLSRPGELPLPLGCNEPARVRALAAAYGALFRRAEYADLGAVDACDAAPPGAPADGSARAAVQALAALYVVDYVEWVVRHLRRLAFALVATLVLATLLLASYPFEPQSLVRAALFLLMAGSVAALLAALVQMNRDPVLSAVTHTDPGKVTWDGPFVLNLVLVGAVPALTLLGTQFPEVRDFLFSWVTPILQTVGRN